MTRDSIARPVLPLALRELTHVEFTLAADLAAPSVVDHDAHAIFVDITAAAWSLEDLLRQSIQALRRGQHGQYLIV